MLVGVTNAISNFGMLADGTGIAYAVRSYEPGFTLALCYDLYGVWGAIHRVIYYIAHYGFIIEAMLLIAWVVKADMHFFSIRELWPGTRWLLTIGLSMIGILLTMLLFGILGYDTMSQHPVLFAIINGVQAVCLFIGYYGAHMNSLLLETSMKRRTLPEICPDDFLDIQPGFERIMKEEGWLWRTDWTMRQLLHELDTNETYLESMCGRCYNQTFAAWVDTRRIERIKALAEQNPHATIKELVTASGFGSVTDVIYAFKRTGNQSFSAWYDQMKATRKNH